MFIIKTPLSIQVFTSVTYNFITHALFLWGNSVTLIFRKYLAEFLDKLGQISVGNLCTVYKVVLNNLKLNLKLT